MNHIAFSVLDLDEAIQWYTEVLGFNLVKEPLKGIADDTHIGRLFQDVFGQGFRKLRLAHLSFGNQVGFEILQFIEPKEEQRQNNFELENRVFSYLRN
jgi:catechol 2,3-dioxygenase-like lactoylglutathione lyase family enzyme